MSSSRRFLLAGGLVLAFGLGAALVVHLATRPAQGRSPPAPAPVVTERPPPEVVPPAPPAPPQPERPPGPPPSPVAERLAPVNAPGSKERLESSDAEERDEAMPDGRDQRRQKMMNWLNRRRNR